MSSNPGNNRNEKISQPLFQHNFLINDLDFLKNIIIKHSHSFEYHNNGVNFYQSKESGFDFSNGLQPLLKNIYLGETPITSDTFSELLSLFRVTYLF